MIVAGLGSMVIAAAGAGSETKGKFYFKKTCKTCHAKGAAGGEVTPLTKTQAQWKDYFATGKHDKGKEDSTKILTPEQLLDVQTFLRTTRPIPPSPRRAAAERGREGARTVRVHL